MSLRLEVPQELASDLERYVRGAGFECHREMRKDIGWPESIYVVAGSVAIIDILYSWLERKKRKDPSITVSLITDKGVRLDLDRVSSDEARKSL